MILFLDHETDRLAAMGYIVTYGRTIAEAETRTRLIKYESVAAVDGVWLATKWSFHEWNPKTDKTGNAVGTARLTDIEFVTPDRDAFEEPDDAAEDPKP